MSASIIEIGKYNTLKVIKETDFGIYIGDEIEEILMPTKWVPEGTQVGDELEAFIYADSEDRLIATTLKPKIVVGAFAYLTVKQVTRFGAFVDWGLEKDLLVPFKEQSKRMEEGKSYLVHLYLDEVTDRLVGSTNYQKFLNKDQSALKEGEKVDLLIFDQFDLGYNALINQQFAGLIYKTEVFRPIKAGDKVEGYIKKVREDGKIDLSLQRTANEDFNSNTELILSKLKENDGVLPLHDKSSPDEIYSWLGISKKNFKKAIGNLYRTKQIKLEPDKITLL